MTTVEVSRKGWEKFCERIQEYRHNAIVSIHWVRPDGAASTIAQDVPLQRVALDDKSDPCNDNLVIEAGLPYERPVRHLIVEPIHIRLKAQGGDRYNRLHILAENGTTVVVFHPGLNPRLLEGLE
jgi:hypothetical protein